MKVLILYTELADYTVACIATFRKKYPRAKVLVFHYPVNPEAPFAFSDISSDAFICVNDIKTFAEMKRIVQSFNPDVVICSGWTNKWYLRICLLRRGSSVNVLTLDNHWRGDLKQYLFALISPVSLRQLMARIWVPGKPQVQYARELGFKSRDIVTGFYSCDTAKFDAYFLRFQQKKKERFPHRFICVARYIPEKGYDTLWASFIEWKKRSPNDWELWCVGTGAMFERRVEHEHIKHLGFIQKDQWEEIIRETGVFVLASRYEPWGVAVHEFAGAGYPLVLSNKVGAAAEFCGITNGSVFDPEDAEDLIHQFERISLLTDDELCAMGSESNRLAKKITPEKWAATIASLQT